MRAWILACAACAAHQTNARSVPIELDAYFNNQAFGTYPGESSFNSLNQSYPASGASQSHNETLVSSSGIEYISPGYRGASTLDNVICTGQTIKLAKPRRAFALSLLHASDVRKKTIIGNVTFTYSDGSMCVQYLSSIELRFLLRTIRHRRCVC
jgi:alpha-L-fucosidase